MNRRGFTLLELILAMSILAILASAVVPTTQKLVKRRKEVELKHALMTMRESVDRFRQSVDDGVIDINSNEQMGYPADFEQMINGLPTVEPKGQHMRFLRRVPVDPMTGEAEWGLRSVQDDPDASSWGGENIFDVYSLSDGIALDGSNYADW